MSKRTTSSSEKASESNADDLTPATFKQKVSLALFLVGLTMVIVVAAGTTLRVLEERSIPNLQVEYSHPAGLSLSPGPATFWHDEERELLLHRGIITEERKVELLELVNHPLESNETRDPESAQIYFSAINKLAFSSSSHSGHTVLLVILLGGLGGAIGIQIRSIGGFIGVVCYKRTLDVKNWWPWYYLRPMLGFLLGALLVVLVKAELFDLEGFSPKGSLWWLGAAVLAGFGSDDFVLKLRLLAKTLFGDGNK